jgi:hypothetical protein
LHPAMTVRMFEIAPITSHIIKRTGQLVWKRVIDFAHQPSSNIIAQYFDFLYRRIKIGYLVVVTERVTKFMCKTNNFVY